MEEQIGKLVIQLLLVGITYDVVAFLRFSRRVDDFPMITNSVLILFNTTTKNVKYSL